MLNSRWWVSSTRHRKTPSKVSLTHWSQLDLKLNWGSYTDDTQVQRCPQCWPAKHLYNCSCQYGQPSSQFLLLFFPKLITMLVLLMLIWWDSAPHWVISLKYILYFIIFSKNCNFSCVLNGTTWTESEKNICLSLLTTIHHFFLFFSKIRSREEK